MNDHSPRTHADPWEAVLAELTVPAAEDPRHAAGPHTRSPTARISRGHPFSARLDSIHCRKQREIEGRRLYAVTFDSEQPFPAQWHWLIAAEHEGNGWVARGGAGGAGNGPARTEPWVNLAGWWGPGRFYAGGEMLSAPELSHVRLTTRDGTILKDDTQAGIVLFLTDRTVELPVTLELLDATGQIVASQLALTTPG